MPVAYRNRRGFFTEKQILPSQPSIAILRFYGIDNVASRKSRPAENDRSALFNGLMDRCGNSVIHEDFLDFLHARVGGGSRFKYDLVADAQVL